MLTIGSALLLVLIFRPNRAWGAFFVIVGAAFLLAVAFDVSIYIGSGRSVSVGQLVKNVQSLTGSTNEIGLEGSREWRLAWWQEIVDYTVHGKYFWTGKGFGINLADADGFQVYGEGALRSPHNGHLTILARSGVPGIVLWIALQLSFSLGLLRACLRATLARDTWWAKVNLWVLAYWLAFMVNGAFDVFLEGPQGGIWFWSLFGFGLIILEIQEPRQAGVSK